MLDLAVTALLVCYLPGALTFRLPFWSRPRRAALAAEERVFWAVLLSVAWSVMVVLALAGLGAYRFERLLWIDAGVSLAALGLGRGRLFYRGEAPRPTWTALVPVALVTVGLWQLVPPAEYVMGGKDPGVYINEGIQIAQRGTLFYRDPVVASVPPPLRDLFFRKVPSKEYYAQRFMGYFLLDPDSGTEVGQFPHGYPASIAIGYGLNGLSGARQAVMFWSALGLLGVYLTGVRVFGRPIAALGAALLLLQVIEVWWGRYPNVEVASRAMLFGSLLAFSHAADGDRGFFGATAGALAGLPLFFRYDTILTIGAVIAAAVLIVAQGRRIGWAFGIALALATSAGLWYLLGPMYVHSASYVSFTTREGTGLLLTAAVGGVIARALLARDRWASLVHAALPWMLATAVVLLAIYAYFIRQPGGLLAVHDAMAFRMFAWYVTPIGLAAAVAGLALSLGRRFWVAPALFVTVVVHATFFFYKTRIVPQHFWWSRRFLTVIEPAAMLAIAALAFWALNPGWWRRLLGPRTDDAARRVTGSGWLVLHIALTLAVLTPLGIAYWRATNPIRHHVEYAGLIPKLESLAGQIGDRDLVLVESRGTGSDLHVLALPLANIYDRHVLVLYAVTPDREQLADFVRWAPAKYDRVLFMGGSGTNLLSRELSATPLSEDRFWVPEYDSPANAYPTEVRLKEFDYGLYELTPRSGPRVGPIEITMGTFDALNVRHFYGPERHDPTGVVFRWTQAQSDVLFLEPDAAAREVVVWMSNGGRPANAGPATTTVSLNGVTLGTVTPDDVVRPYAFSVPAGLAETAARAETPAVLRLETPTWRPAEWLGVADPRELGVMVTRVQIR